MSSDNATPPANEEAIMLENLVADLLEAQQMEEGPNSARQAYRSTYHYEYLQGIHSQIMEQIKDSSPTNIKPPSCYKNKSFWMRPPNPVFSISSGDVVDPLNWCKPDVFVWLPRLMIPSPKLHYPYCSGTREKIHGYPHPRRVVDVDRCFYLLTTQHECTNPLCQSMFNFFQTSSKPQLLDQLRRMFLLFF
jgi:hypothetical protein